MTDELSLPEARRLVLAAQGFGAARPAAPSTLRLARLLDHLTVFQIDSVNVLARAHYLPAFSRLGPYDRASLDRFTAGPPARRRGFEYWAHEASILPLDLHPLLRWRMARADRGLAGWDRLRAFATERRPEAQAILDRIRADGPLAASDLDTGRPGWWSWTDSKAALEWLFWAGHVTTKLRRPSFERVYDLTERVLPAAALALPTPDPADAHRALIDRAARALGVATAAELRDYHRLDPADAVRAINTLREDGVLVPTRIPNWPPAFRHRDARAPRRVRARALLAPFDPLIWERTRTERLFGFTYRIEIYTPAARRTHGYYVLPFLHGDRLVARVDLKNDRAARTLHARAIHLEPHAGPDTRDALAAELALMARWLDLDRVTMPPTGHAPSSAA